MFICRKVSDRTGNYQSTDEVDEWGWGNVPCFVLESGAIKAISLKKKKKKRKGARGRGGHAA